MNKFVVCLKRGDKQVLIVLSASDYSYSERMVKGVRKMHWGSGPMWEVLAVVDYNVYIQGGK